MEMDLVAEAIVVMAQKGSTKIFFLYFFLLYKCFVEVCAKALNHHASFGHIKM